MTHNNDDPAPVGNVAAIHNIQQNTILYLRDQLIAAQAEIERLRDKLDIEENVVQITLERLEAANATIARLTAALEGIIAITDRKHIAWDNAKLTLAAVRDAKGA